MFFGLPLTNFEPLLWHGRPCSGAEDEAGVLLNPPSSAHAIQTSLKDTLGNINPFIKALKALLFPPRLVIFVMIIRRRPLRSSHKVPKLSGRDAAFPAVQRSRATRAFLARGVVGTADMVQAAREYEC